MSESEASQPTEVVKYNVRTYYSVRNHGSSIQCMSAIMMSDSARSVWKMEFSNASEIYTFTLLSMAVPTVILVPDSKETKEHVYL